MKEFIVTGNELSRLMLKDLATTLPGVHIGSYAVSYCSHLYDRYLENPGLFDSYSLFLDILARPQLYLNGTAPLNTTGAIRSCVYELNESLEDTGNCTIITGSDADSYLW